MPSEKLKWFSFVKTETLDLTEVSEATIIKLSYTLLQSHTAEERICIFL